MSLREHLTAGAVLIGSLVLVGPPTYVVVAVGLEWLQAVAGVPGRTAGPVTVIAALGTAIYVAGEVADLQLHGRAALWRGSRRWIVVRHAVLSTVVLAALLEVGWVALASLSWTVTGRSADPGTATLAGALAVLLVVAVWGVALLFGLGVREGYARAID